MRPKAGGKTDVRFGSKADTCGAKRYVRFTPESGHDLATPALSSWATGLTAHVWASNPFVDQNCTHVAPLCPQARTQTTVVALLRPFGPRRTTTRDTLQSRLTIGNELAEAGGCRVSEFPLTFAACERAGFRSIKSDKPICLSVGANCIAVHDRY
jgi:hypothetical protein